MRWISLILLVGFAACTHASNEPVRAGTAVEELRGGLRELGKDISRATASAADSRTNNDPNTFRGRLQAEYDQLHQRFEGLRVRSRELLTTDREKANDEERQKLQQELDETQRNLDALQKQLDTTET